MKLIYTHENRLLVSNAQNMIEQAGISTTLKNEYTAGAMGDVAPIDSWMELWVIDDSHYEKSLSLLEKIKSNTQQKDWHCSQCNEENDAAFDFCWKCKTSPQSV